MIPRVWPRSLLLGVSIVVLNLYDAIITRVLLNRGAFEANPLVAPVIREWWFMGLKIVLPAAAVVMALQYDERSATKWLIAVAGLYMCVAGWNTALLWRQ